MKKSVLYPYIILYYNFVISFIICLIHLDLCNIFIYFLYEIPFLYIALQDKVGGAICK